MEKEKMELLQKPLKPSRVIWRVQQSGMSNGKPWAMVLAYMDNRAVQERFDEVFGIFGWKNEYKTAPDGGTLCGISVKNEGEWITKWDGSENTAVEAVKGGLSGSMKRAAVQWGVGRYLYDLPSIFAQTSLEKKNGWNKAKAGKTNDWFYWENPKLPSWAVPKDDTKQKQESEQSEEVKAKLEKINAQFERALRAAKDKEAPIEQLTNWSKMDKSQAIKDIAKWIKENEAKK